MNTTNRGVTVVVALTAAVALAAGCSSAPAAEETEAAPGSGAAAGDDPCAAYAAYQGHEGTTVSVFSPVRGAEAERFQESWATFTECTGIDLAYEGSDDFETRIGELVAEGNPPDVALVPQPGLVRALAERGVLAPAAGDVATAASAHFSPSWLAYGTVADELYATPLDATVKGFVWYDADLFREHGWTVPRTWDELTELSAEIAATGTTPWCVGIESGVATGWPATDWIEDVLLRAEGPEVYDAWVEHAIPFDDPRVVAAAERAGAILRDPDLAGDGAGGDATAIAETPYQVAGQRLLEGGCALYNQASSFATHWPSGTEIGADGDVAAFPLPPITAEAAPATVVGGHFVVGFADRPEVEAVRAYLAGPEFANSRAELGSWVSPNSGLDAARVPGEAERLAAELLQHPEAVVRFDGSDLMPSAVGTGSFWSGMTDWLLGAETEDVLREIETGWPAE
ncbi:ABC transporter substrate-binding protein [Streptomyces triticirhizae]|uniref:Carbohydrate ABC transporter substrate-binding protein n=1 Tax=Streptomyces triticirhizae TaxID=2483353 RepID=A0A3M2LR54_9ACTN|nr:ABC transporter substrate-binding protein [Streptomyces triticirhizae]RMI39033.1 carbohydrate ABC transporter substrate-binding protein [Streptomyces triticirhizae]